MSLFFFFHLNKFTKSQVKNLNIIPLSLIMIFFPFHHRLKILYRRKEIKNNKKKDMTTTLN